VNGSEPRLIRASTINPVPVDWLWRPWLPRGKLVILDGNPGCGKSTVALDIAARVTTGAAMPTGEADEVAQVAVLNAEDATDDTVRPRLDAAGADCDRVFVWDWRSDPLSFPGQAAWLHDRITEHGIRLVVLDTLTSFLGGTIDSHRDQDVRSALIPVVDVAGETGATVLAIRHLNKNSQVAAIHRGMGSVAFGALARSVLLAGEHPDGDGFVLSPVKGNLAAAPKSLRYRIVDRGDRPVIEWGGQCDLTADDQVAPQTHPSALSAAVRFLEEFLEEGPMPASDLEAAAEDEGISIATLRRARKRLGVRSEKRGSSNLVSLPAQHAQPQGPEQVEQVL